VNAGSSPGNISPLFGHNIAWVSEGNRLWDGVAPNWRVKPQALPIIQEAMAKKPGFMRFPGGNQADTYRWRRGVGWPIKARATRVFGTNLADRTQGHHNSLDHRRNVLQETAV
jgi:hypothetical protein